MAKRQDSATFNVRLVGPGLSLRDVPLRSLSRVLSAVQRLLEPEADDDGPVSAQAKIHLIGVRTGSAIYRVSADLPEETLSNLTLAGERLKQPDRFDVDIAFLGAIEELSEVAKSLGCEIELRKPSGRDQVLAKIGPQTFGDISGSAFVFGQTRLVAKIERVGGATEMHCGIRLAEQPRKMVICRVSTEELTRQLGQFIYQDVLLDGMATWVRGTLQLRRMTITGVRQLGSGSFTDALERIGQAGGSAWDMVQDIDETIGRTG